jgi:hypothetical protein
MVPPRAGAGEFRSFWSSGTGWGVYTVNGGRTTLRLDHGSLACRSCTVRATGAAAKVTVNRKPVDHKIADGAVTFPDRVVLREGDELAIEVTA